MNLTPFSARRFLGGVQRSSKAALKRTHSQTFRAPARRQRTARSAWSAPVDRRSASHGLPPALRSAPGTAPPAPGAQPGEKLWEFQTGAEVYSSPAIGQDGTVYVGSGDGKVYALNGGTGARLWEFVRGG